MSKWTVADIPSQAGKLAIVTGANSGIGWHTALELARAGAEVVLAVRAEEKGRSAAERITRQIPAAKVRFELLDLADLKSVRAFACKLNQEKKLDLLVNNAGVMAIPKRRKSVDGFEMQLATNYLGHFALTLLLMPALQRSSSPRVTTVASLAANMMSRKIHFDDLQLEKSYGPAKAYCQSKLANLFLMMELARRFEETGINLVSNVAHPGYARTNLQTSGPGRERSAFHHLMEKLLSQNAAAGAAPTLRAATSAETASGAYYAPSGLFRLKGAPVPIGVPKVARNAVTAKKLWAISEELTGVPWLVAYGKPAGFLRR